MRPHTNIGIIDTIGVGRTTLTAAITASLVEHRPEPTIAPAPKEDLRALWTSSAQAHYVMPGPPTHEFHYYPPGGPPRMRREPDPPPPREKTAVDLARMAAAQAKRDRKAAKKLPHG
jgi:hypothetical protein